MARTYHTFDSIVIGSASDGFPFVRELLKHTQNMMFIDASAQESYASCADVIIREALRRNGTNGDAKSFLKHLRAAWKGYEEAADEGWKGIGHYCVAGKVSFEGAQSVRLNGKLLHARSIVFQSGSKIPIPSSVTTLSKNRVFTTETLVKLKTPPTEVRVSGQNAMSDALRQVFGESESNTQDSILIATEQLPAVKSFQLEKTQLQLDENGLPIFNPADGKVKGADFFVFDPLKGKAAREKLLAAVLNSLKEL